MRSDILRIGLSPCPNDTFIFDALLHGKIDTENITFDPFIADVEELNHNVFNGNMDVSKVSYHAFLYLVKDFVLLDAGSALGRGCGPLLISREKLPLNDMDKMKIAIPGRYTTANLLLSLAFPEALNKTEIVFSEIENAVIQKHFDCGLIIHESRFTYKDKGLVSLLDLGEYWESRTGAALPLGGIVVNRKLPLETRHKLNRIMKRSVEFAFENPASSKDFVKKNSRELNDEVIQSHIDLYVTGFTRDLGSEGRDAVKTLFREAKKAGIIQEEPESLFIN